MRTIKAKISKDMETTKTEKETLCEEKRGSNVKLCNPWFTSKHRALAKLDIFCLSSLPLH